MVEIPEEYRRAMEAADRRAIVKAGYGHLLKDR